MLVSLTWLKKYVAIPVDTEALVNDLTMRGLNVEGCSTRGLQEKSIVVGNVLEVSKHPHADKLTCCRVEVGPGDVREIICGAPNVAAGQKVPVALVGARLHDGTKIKKTKIRGIASEGMICSEIELGMGSDAEGIVVLDENLEIGRPVAAILSPPDTVLEIEVTPNRPDLLSHIGVAREIAAIYQTKLNIPHAKIKNGGAARPPVGLEVEDVEDCPRYTGRIIRGVKVGPSPAWMAAALEAVGLNSINNIVDITNFVMMELGQPLHAFDLAKLSGAKVAVRRALDGEELRALDGETYELKKDFLVIADGRSAVALAGIIGGEETAVEENTVDVFLECACFDPTLVRKNRKALNITTDASYRFERGMDREICRAASDRACSLMAEIAGGSPGEMMDAYGKKLQRKRITLRSSSAKRLLGVKITPAEIKELLEPLGFGCKGAKGESLDVEVPSFRADIIEEADLIEEAARTYGYIRIGSTWDYRCTTFAQRDEYDDFVEFLLDHLVAQGFYEVITSSFTDGSEIDYFGWPEGDPRRDSIRIRNPLTANQTFLRTSLLPGMLEVVKRNIDRGINRMNLCQAGKVFLGCPAQKGLPEELNILTLVMTTPAGDDFWLHMRKPLYLFDIKSVIEMIASILKIDLWHDFCYDFESNKGQFTYSKKNRLVIAGGIIPRETAGKYDFDQPVWYADIDLGRFFQARLETPRFRPLPEFPVSKRDLSLVLGRGTTYEQVEKTLVKTGGSLIESIKLFDVYRGKSIPKGGTAYGVRIHFRSPERTLTDNEVDQLVAKILAKLKNELGVDLRS